MGSNKLEYISFINFIYVDSNKERSKLSLKVNRRNLYNDLIFKIEIN